MGDSRKADYEKYEMAPTSDPEKGGEFQQQEEAEWTGLGKEELLRVANTPAWNWSRTILLVLFWVAWVAMLVAAIVIVVKVPRCPEVEWWEKSTVYQVFPRSFRDSDKDGVGDIKGVTENLDYLKGIGVKVIYLNSIFQQPNKTSDIGYDIVNFTNVDPLLGNLTHFDELMSAVQEKEMKLILEFVPNHSGDKHPWFLSSKMAKDNKYSNYYIWANGSDDTGTNPPNDWKNVYGESAWTYVPERGQFYYHRFLASQPDLNYGNPSVNQAMMDAMQFWLDHKVDGFVYSNIEYLVDPQLVEAVVVPGDAPGGSVSRRRRQATDQPGTTAAAAGATATTAAAGQPAAATEAPQTPAATEGVTQAPVPEPEPEPETNTTYVDLGGEVIADKEKLAGILREWRSLLNNASYLGKYRLMVTESKFDLDTVIMQYGKNDSYLADYPLNLGLVEVLNKPLDGNRIMEAVNAFIKAKEDIGAGGRYSTWAFGSHNTKRLADRVGEAYVRALNMLLLTLPGTPVAYYGDELGVPGIEIGSLDDVVDPVARQFTDKWMELTRDPERAPLPWSNATYGNFTKGNSTWLPLPANYEMVNVKMQQEDEMSTVRQFSTLVKYHSEPSIVAGNFNQIITSESTISYVRAYPDWPSYMVAMNVGASEVMENFHTAGGGNVPAKGSVIISTSGEKEGKKAIDMDGLKLMPGEAVLVEFPRE